MASSKAAGRVLLPPTVEPVKYAFLLVLSKLGSRVSALLVGFSVSGLRPYGWGLVSKECIVLRRLKYGFELGSLGMERA